MPTKEPLLARSASFRSAASAIHRSMPTTCAKRRYKSMGSVAGRALVDGRIVHIADIKTNSEYTFFPRLHLGNFRTAIGVPLREGEPIRVLAALTRREVLPFTDKQSSWPRPCRPSSDPTENVRLFERARVNWRSRWKTCAPHKTAWSRHRSSPRLVSSPLVLPTREPAQFCQQFLGGFSRTHR